MDPFIKDTCEREYCISIIQIPDLFSELRDRIRKSRLEEDKAVNHLQRVKNRNEQLEAEMNLFKEQGMCVVEPTQESGANVAGEHSSGRKLGETA